jgi:hypothetical protein
MCKAGDIIIWENIRFEVIDYDKETNKGTVKALEKVAGIWEKGDITHDFSFGRASVLTYLHNPSNELTELEYLRLFYKKCDFGPDHVNILYKMDEEIERETNKFVPEEYANHE